MKYEFVNGKFSDTEIKGSYDECGFAVIRDFLSQEDIGNMNLPGITSEIYRFGKHLCDQPMGSKT
jgi:hypothetical protein